MAKIKNDDRLLAMLSDGQTHDAVELMSCLDDVDFANRDALRVAMHRLRAGLPPDMAVVRLRPSAGGDWVWQLRSEAPKPFESLVERVLKILSDGEPHPVKEMCRDLTISKRGLAEVVSDLRKVVGTDGRRIDCVILKRRRCYRMSRHLNGRADK